MINLDLFDFGMVCEIVRVRSAQTQNTPFKVNVPVGLNSEQGMKELLTQVCAGVSGSLRVEPLIGAPSALASGTPTGSDQDVPGRPVTAVNSAHTYCYYGPRRNAWWRLTSSHSGPTISLVGIAALNFAPTCNIINNHAMNFIR
ncbi:hypothetical protein AG1IA_08271 [Rhizoctonia solani AG-1 IA]|uniref:Uncharacterized protein n=1 Tax=Thanatephorus cucumeris (strain AG1-IA) TaxID=983506 RepID=L8WMW9_THACA|nr:hypothetical protein AG1IA_08271 [Rhizoctonia solani AG-1 IA]